MITIFEALIISVVSLFIYVVVKAAYETWFKD
jgi:hypothetical protein